MTSSSLNLLDLRVTVAVHQRAPGKYVMELLVTITNPLHYPLESGWIIYGPENVYNFPYSCLPRVNMAVGNSRHFFKTQKPDGVCPRQFKGY